MKFSGGNKCHSLNQKQVTIQARIEEISLIEISVCCMTGWGFKLSLGWSREPVLCCSTSKVSTLLGAGSLSWVFDRRPWTTVLPLSWSKYGCETVDMLCKLEKLLPTHNWAATGEIPVLLYISAEDLSRCVSAILGAAGGGAPCLWQRQIHIQISVWKVYEMQSNQLPERHMSFYMCV